MKIVKTNVYTFMMFETKVTVPGQCLPCREKFIFKLQLTVVVEERDAAEISIVQCHCVVTGILLHVSVACSVKRM